MLYTMRIMLLTITNTKPPASDLGYLLHKNPARCQSFELAFGKAHVFYPEVSSDRCTAALLLDVDPVGLVRHRRGRTDDSGTLDQYVNDRPYVASSFLSVAIARVFGSALAGSSKPKIVVATTPNFEYNVRFASLTKRVPVCEASRLLAQLGGQHLLRYRLALDARRDRAGGEEGRRARRRLAGRTLQLVCRLQGQVAGLVGLLECFQVV